ncbi:MAG: addiction module protein [Pirellulaceae bacterium]|nr:addiction module protein [Pirellulaceae bacterium]
MEFEGDSMSHNLALDQMTVAERLAALEAIWASLCRNPVDVISPGWHEEVLAERRRRLASGATTLSDWCEAKERLQGLGR